MNRRRRQSLVGMVAGALLVTTLGAAINGAGTPGAAAGPPRGDGELPAGASSRMEQIMRTVPGNGGESSDGPGGGADAAFDARAYPGKSVSLEKSAYARRAFRAAKERFAEQAGPSAAVGAWERLGPSEALYPLTEFRNSGNYVPNAYVAGGRTTSIALSDSCTEASCRLYITPAGGGVWRTDNALASEPTWTYLGGPLGINAAGSVTIDPNDPSGNTVYVGTGEANICGSGCVAGVGMYKSTDGGDSWTGPLGGPAFDPENPDRANPLAGKGIGEIVIAPGDPETIYAATTTALRGMSSVCCSGVTRPVPGAAQWGLYKSTDAGQNWRMIHNGTADESQCTGSQAQFSNTEPCSPRGVRSIVLDPTNSDIVYAASYARGVWRSLDAGETWTQIKPSLASNVITTRASIAVTTLDSGDTRMYVYEGNVGTPYARLFRSDKVQEGTPVFQDLTSANPADPGYATYNQCTGQCWYDQFVYTPEGEPDIVYTGGSYLYGETGGISNGRGVVLSTDAGVSGTDMTMDGTDPTHPNGLHPDQHDIVTVPGNPFLFIEANDGGVMRSNGKFDDRSSWCDDRGLTEPALSRCKQLLSNVPNQLIGMNKGLDTLQFTSLSANPHQPGDLQGGTQDNGTWENYGQRDPWLNTMIGDGGASGFDREVEEFRFHNFFDVTPEVNFDNGDIGGWIWTADPLFGQPGNQFYAPVISDPVVSGTMWAGTGKGVYRTTTFGLGNRSLEEANRICNTWTGTFEARCGDWKKTGGRDLTAASWGDRPGGAVAAVERNTDDTTTAWAATTTGRLFWTTRADASDPSAVRWNRLDSTASNDPQRFVSSVFPVDEDTALVSYSGYSATTPSTPGHVFRVDVQAVGSSVRATWTDLSANMGDLPVTDLVQDPGSGDLFASTDFGVMRRASGAAGWTMAAAGMPFVEVAGLTLAPQGGVLYAATHGQGAWRLALG